MNKKSALFFVLLAFLGISTPKIDAKTNAKEVGEAILKGFEALGKETKKKFVEAGEIYREVGEKIAHDISLLGAKEIEKKVNRQATSLTFVADQLIKVSNDMLKRLK